MNNLVLCEECGEEIDFLKDFIELNGKHFCHKCNLECASCGVRGSWDYGSPNGTLYSCELCGEIVCVTCLDKHRGLEEELIICSREACNVGI